MQDALTHSDIQNRNQTHWDDIMDSIDSREVARINLDENYSFNWFLLAIGVLATLIIFTLPVVAGNFDDPNSNIMYVIDSPILRGRNDMVAQYSTGIAWCAQLLITACGFFIICLKTVTIAFTLLYLTHPDFWNKVSDVKSDISGRGDWLGTIVSWVTPDVKALSEYSDTNDDKMYNSGGMQSIGNYVKQNAVQFVALVTLASVLWSGKLLKLVGALSEGCVAVFDWAMAIDYGGKVEMMLSADRNYVFLYDKSTTTGKNKEKLANSLYSQVKTAVSDNNTSEFYNNVGKAIQEEIDNLTVIGTDAEDTPAPHVKWENPTLSMSMTWNSDKPDGAPHDSSSWKNGVYQIPLNVLIPDGIESTTRQQLMKENGIIYVTFGAQQTYNPADFQEATDGKNK